MNISNQRKIKLISASVLAAALAACGGGGSDSAPSGGNVAAPAPTPKPVVPFEPPPPTYAAGSDELAAYTVLNAERAHCGFGKLQQNTLLDKAARNHAEWMRLNNTVSHDETPGTPGFTGVDPNARAVAVGFSGIVGENAGVGTNVNAAGRSLGEGFIRKLLSVPYHGISLVGMTEGDKVGIGLSDPVLFPSGDVWKFGAVELNGASTGGAALQTYPCEGSTGVITMIGGRVGAENPSPIPGRDWANNPSGSAILVVATAGKTLKLGPATLVHVASGASIPVRPGVTNGVGNVMGMALNTGFYLPEFPMQPNSRYQFSFSGTESGQAFSKTFSFTTGPV